MYRSTFINISGEEDEHSVRRSQSSPNLSSQSGEEPGPAIEANRNLQLQDFMERTAQNFQWGEERTPRKQRKRARPPCSARAPEMSSSLVPGGHGHPEVCSRPCVRFAYGSCANGDSCSYCHLGHPTPKTKLDKTQRQYYDSLAESQVLSLVLPFLKRRGNLHRICNEMSCVLGLLEDRLADQPAAHIPMWKVQELERSLHRMSTARLVELVTGSPKVDPLFGSQITDAFAQARRGVHARRMQKPMCCKPRPAGC